MGRLSGKIAIVTGAARGMGESHARTFVREGAKVVLTDLRVDAGRALQKELGDAAIFVEHDVTDLAQWATVVEKAEAAFGPVDCSASAPMAQKRGCG